MLEVGQMAPDFTLTAHTGENVILSELRGNTVVLFFYPKDNTPGCTRESCAFRDLNQEFGELGVHVYGISRDSLASHNKFADKYNLNMPLLSDSDEKVVTAYGVLKEKTNYGRTSIGIERTTVVIDKNGVIAKIFPKVKVDGHADKVLEFVKSMDV